MAVLSAAQLQAKNLLDSIGLDEITNMDIKLFASGLGAVVIEEDMGKCEGRFTPGAKTSIIKINSSIKSMARKRFVIAHEIGHLIMHKGQKLPDDNFYNFNLIEGIEEFLKFGPQEVEANEFAGELLIPTHLFEMEARGKKFGPQLIKDLATRFQTSLTAVVHKYVKSEISPVCIMQVTNGKLRYWKKTSTMKVWLEPGITKLPPPSDSVAMEYVRNRYGYIYFLEEKAQKIKRTTWFGLIGDQQDTDFFEYCIPTKQHNSVLSVVWEE
ncbi:MAG: ImmA/IrrE family metallo-endopeptidase [Cyclobacteriaceae bacterium]|nr:ImmA/IrrE family metallo-endopeptidase [Cyclobacteriaceae bacterium]